MSEEMEDEYGFEFMDPYDSMPFGDLMRFRDKELDEDEAAGEYDAPEEKPMNYVDLLALILPILPNATLGQDNDGQVIIYTDMKMDGYDIVPFDQCTCFDGHVLDGGLCDNETEDDDDAS